MCRISRLTSEETLYVPVCTVKRLRVVRSCQPLQLSGLPCSKHHRICSLTLTCSC
jgi:hypothetical protein